MQIKLGIRQTAFSLVVFCGVLVALISVDARVRERVSEVFTGGDGITTWGDRVGDLAEAIGTAIRYQSIENAPLLVFATVGAVLFLFMVKA